MSYTPPIPPVVPPPPEMGVEWLKRYMTDNSQFRDVLRAWIKSANACCDDHEARIDVLEASISTDFDEGDSTSTYTGAVDYDEGDST